MEEVEGGRQSLLARDAQQSRRATELETVLDWILEIPDISEDLARLSVLPTVSPTQAPTPEPSHAPTSEPSSQPSPVPSSQPSSQPSLVPTSQPTPVPTPATAQPTSSPTSSPTEPVEETSSTTTQVRTVFSCPPPSSKTVEAHDENGSTVLIEIPPPMSTVRIPYEFQVQLTGDQDIEDVLPDLEGRLEDSIGGYLKSNTENGEDEDECEGYYIEDFRRRTLRHVHRGLEGRRVAGEDVPTKVIGLTSAEDLAVDETKQCVPQNKNCFVVSGALDCTYVGYNEPGVRSSISRAVKEEMSDNGDGGASDGNEYSVQYMGTEYAATDGGTRTSETPSAIGNLLNMWQEAMPDTHGSQLTPYGISILAALGSAFLVVCYIVFIKSDAKEKVRDELDKRKEKKSSKKKALCDEDSENRHEDQSYCYDLESVAIEGASNHDCDMDSGVEIVSSRSFGSAKVAAATVGSGKTKKMSNRTKDVTYSDAQKLSSLFEDDDDDDDGESSIGVIDRADAGCSVRSTDSRDRMTPPPSFPPSRSPTGTPLVDRCPSSARSTPVSMDFTGSPTEIHQLPSMTEIHQLPSISEDHLPPPMNDTPHIFQRPAKRPAAPESDAEEREWEV